MREQRQKGERSSNFKTDISVFHHSLRYLVKHTDKEADSFVKFDD